MKKSEEKESEKKRKTEKTKKVRVLKLSPLALRAPRALFSLPQFKFDTQMEETRKVTVRIGSSKQKQEVFFFFSLVSF